MNKRQRKKWLKKHGKYINPKDTWNMDFTLAEYILPRLELFKKLTNGYPGYGEMNTFEKWQDCLDQMILAFKYLVEGDNWDKEDKYNWFDYMYFEKTEKGYSHKLTSDGESRKTNYDNEAKRRQDIIENGLQLFAKYYQDLWW